MVERIAHNGFVVGSNPAKLKKFNSMKLKIKNYKYLKVKKYFKNSNFFLIYNGTNVKKFIKTDQKLKKLNLEYYKVYNTLTKKALNKSIYRNFKPLINGLSIVLKLNKNFTNLTFKDFLDLDDSLKLVGLKINNKIYTVSTINSSTEFNYKNNNLAFLRFLKVCLKVSYKITI